MPWTTLVSFTQSFEKWQMPLNEAGSWEAHDTTKAQPARRPCTQQTDEDSTCLGSEEYTP
jgi:hypothetical protein